MIRRLVAALVWLMPALALAQAGPPPGLDIVMAPHATGGADSYLGVTMTVATPSLHSGEGLVRLPLKLVGIPSARYDGDALQASDDKGPLPLTQNEEPPTPQGTYRRWLVSRDTVGNVVVCYHAPPRKVTAATNNGPLFDLREENGGFIGAGVGFLATPVKQGPWRVHLKWDLSAAPAGSRGAWTLGDGDVDTVAVSDQLSFSYYAVGPLKSIPPAGNSDFALYWLGDPPFDANVLGDRILKLYTAMARFFHDEKSSYRVFMRQNPYAGTGGSGLGHSFMFGYRPEDRPAADSLQPLLSHEIAHNWPSMQGEHGDTAWYSEGTAEFYSTLLAYRAGLLGLEGLVSDFNEKATAYYTNPHRALSNPEAAKLFWSDPIAQTVPYGRGFLYLIATDAAIRQASRGKRSLDDVVLVMRQRQVTQQSYGIADWLKLVGAEIGTARARHDYDAMVAGDLLHLATARFASCMRVVEGTASKFDLGFARSSLNDDRVVRDLEPASAAARAGVQNGDVIVEANDVSKVRKDNSLPMILKLRRGDTLVDVSYRPRGDAVPVEHWVLAPKAKPETCRF